MRFRPGLLVVSMAVLALAGCGSSDPVREVSSSACVEIPNGQYFQFVDGRLVATSSSEISAQERPEQTLRRIAATLAGMGYPWVTLTWDGSVATVSGIALDDNARSDAYIAAKSAFEADPVSGPLVERVINNLDVHAAEKAIALRLTDELVLDDGLAWLRVVIAGRVATLDGVAASVQEKEVGYNVGRSTVESDLAAGQLVNIVVDAIQVRGGESPVGTALVDLASEPTVAACQRAFNAVMDGREVAFELNESTIQRASSRLLDAITGVALLCENHDIEIAGRAGADIIAADALELTQRRASSIRDYLMAYGVAPDALSARGYGQAEQTGLAPDARPNVPNTSFSVRARDS
ncbi:MAG: OmpA family protein [Pseudomonadota bacterium]